MIENSLTFWLEDFDIQQTYMPLKNHFRHQEYHASQPTAEWRLVDAQYPPQPDSESFAKRMSAFADSIDGKVDAIWFVHGTFAGNDALGWFSQLERLVPAAGPVLKSFGKKLTDVLAGDSGNFPPRFVELFETNSTVRRFVWSGENTHSGRNKARGPEVMEMLLDQLLSRVDQEPQVMIWGHSHAGNVAALITNLIAAEPWVRDKFLDLVEPLFPARGPNKCPLMRVRSAIESGKSSKLQLDVINFGSPVCYGWDTAGYRSLTHVVAHVPQANQPEWLCPVSLKHAKAARDGSLGDVVQVLGITGSNFLPWLLSKSFRAVEQTLHDFLAPSCDRKNYWARARLGMRVADEGTTLLVSYEDVNGLARETMGHSIYTKPQWLSFHLKLLTEFGIEF
jgi:hypothetical protein